MAKRSFGRVLDGIVSVVLASAVGAVSSTACGGTSAITASDGGPLHEGGTGVGFEDDDTFQCNAPLGGLLTNLKPAIAVDYVEIRTQSFDSPNRYRPPVDEDGGASDAGAADAGPPPIVLKTGLTNGQACANASNRSACTTALAAASVKSASDGWPVNRGGGGSPSPPTLDSDFLVYTRGDEVGVVSSTATLAAFLGTVDTLEEARLLLVSQGSALTCSTGRKTGWRQNSDGSWEIITDGDTCSNVLRYRYKIGANGSVTLIGEERDPRPVACGRRPEGLAESAAAGGFALGLGAYFAEVAHLEAASVVAFRRLELELRRFGAPEDLITRARRARADEIRHARETALLARRFGGEIRPLEIAPMNERDLLSIAVENATEGCVRETYGALVASFQARAASDPEVRSVLGRIARDESRHAELSHDVATWLDTQLDSSARARVASERHLAIEELRSAIEQAPAADVIERAGMPTVFEARALLDGLERVVLAA